MSLHVDSLSLLVFFLFACLFSSIFFSSGIRSGDGWSRTEVDEVNWFARANELSPVNQGLMGYPGMGNLVRELEQVRRNVRHTWHKAKARGEKMDQESNVEFCLKKWDAAADAARAALVPGKELATGEKSERFWWTDSETGQAGGFWKAGRYWSWARDDLNWSAPSPLMSCNLTCGLRGDIPSFSKKGRLLKLTHKHNLVSCDVKSLPPWINCSDFIWRSEVGISSILELVQIQLLKDTVSDQGSGPGLLLKPSYRCIPLIWHQFNCNWEC